MRGWCSKAKKAVIIFEAIKYLLKSHLVGMAVNIVDSSISSSSSNEGERNINPLSFDVNLFTTGLESLELPASCVELGLQKEKSWSVCLYFSFAKLILNNVDPPKKIQILHENYVKRSKIHKLIIFFE